MGSTKAAQRRGRADTRLRAILRDDTDPFVGLARNWRHHGFGAEAHLLGASSITRVEQLGRRANEAVLAPHQLTHARHEALTLLRFSRSGAMPLKRLSERLFSHPASITVTVDALERLGFAERVPHSTDRRTTLAAITDAGRAVIDGTCQAMTAAPAPLAPLTDEQASTVFAVLRRVRQAAGDPISETRPGPAGDPVLDAVDNWHRNGWGAGMYLEAGLSIIRAEELVRRSNDQSLRPFSLTQARHEALTLLYFSDHGTMTMGKLGERLLIQPTSVTSTVDTLARLRLAERTPHPTDRRATLAQITKWGRAVLEESSSVLAADRLGIGMLSAHEAVDLYEALRPVRVGAGDILEG